MLVLTSPTVLRATKNNNNNNNNNNKPGRRQSGRGVLELTLTGVDRAVTGPALTLTGVDRAVTGPALTLTGVDRAVAGSWNPNQMMTIF